jgi:putative ABC transport system substrate-binding protein
MVTPDSTSFCEDESMNNRLVIRLLATVVLATVSLAQGQQPTKRIPRVGFLSLNPASVQKDRVEAFREALRKLGYVEGQNINIEYRYADSK